MLQYFTDLHLILPLPPFPVPGGLWEPFTQLFTEYQTLSDIPRDSPGKMNLWVRKFSEKVQKNLAPFFEAWGWPVEEEVASSLACLPEWEENPMRVYI